MFSDESIPRALDSNRDRELIRQIAALLAADMSLAALFERLCELLAHFVDASVTFVALTQPDGTVLVEYAHDHGEIRRRPGIVMQPGSRTLEVLRTGKTIYGGHPQSWSGHVRVPLNADRPETDDTVSAVFVPLRTQDETIGVLSVQSQHADAYAPGDVALLEACAHYLAIAVRNQRLYAAMRRLAEHDVLTDLANHSTIVRTLDRALRGASANSAVAAMLINITNFASFNATFGYAQGDRILRRVADLLHAMANDRISVGRYAGDEFLVVVEGTSAAQTRELVDGMYAESRLLDHRSDGANVPISLACGYAFAPREAATRADLLVLAAHRRRQSRSIGGEPIGGEAMHGLHIQGSFNGIETIVESLLLRDPYTRVHLHHVNALAAEWSEHLAFSPYERQTFIRAALLHDVGKMLIADRILVKPAKLTADEYSAIQRHAEFGRNILAPYPEYAEIAEIVGQHHERFDGRGYPKGLAAPRIHPLARAVSILDAFSAMVMDRPYHRGIPAREALAELVRCSGTQFDPEYVASFVAFFDPSRHR